jgi:hypothetical protein
MRGGRTFAGGLVVAAVALLSSTTPAVAAAAGVASFSVRPAHYDPADPATRAYFKRQVIPGASFTDDVVVANGGRTAVTFRIYGVDGLTGQTSGSVYANRSDARRRAGRWLSVGMTRLTLAPGRQTMVPFTVRVPRGAEPGDHLAGLAFEDTSATTSGGNFRIRTIVREVIGVLVRVPGPARPRLHVGRIALRTLAGTRLGAVMIRLGDTGRLLCKPKLSVALRGGTSRMRIARQLDTVLPGDAITYPLILRQALPPASYAVSARASCPGTVARAHALVRLGTPLAGTRSAPAKPPTLALGKSGGGLSLWLAGGVAAATALVGLALGLLFRLRRPAR